MIVKIDEISVEIIRKNIKTLRLAVLPPDGKVRISAPESFPKNEIEKFVRSKKSWIEKQQQRIENMSPAFSNSYSPKNKFLLFGKEYDFNLSEVDENKMVLIFCGDNISFVCSKDFSTEKREKFIEDFYRSQLKERISERLPYYENIMGLYSNSFQIKKMKTRWGSCNTQSGNIVFNLLLSKYEPICLDYIIIHELAHLKESNHGENFKAILSKYMPEWKNIQGYLNGKNSVF